MVQIVPWKVEEDLLEKLLTFLLLCVTIVSITYTEIYNIYWIGPELDLDNV